jgi:hypothetical protein
VALAALLLVACREAVPAQAPGKDRLELFLLTPLPLVWSEGFGLDQPGSRVLQRLKKTYRVTPIDLPSDLPKGALLLAAQPRALPAEELVALDKWVRAGGRVLLLADPMLEWPSQWPLGDARRPPMGFADTGLLKHWGLRLDAPEQRGVAQALLDGRAVTVASAGTLAAEGKGCEISGDGLRAGCRIGQGEAIVIADADFINAGSDPRNHGNLAALLSQLHSLRR